MYNGGITSTISEKTDCVGSWHFEDTALTSKKKPNFLKRFIFKICLGATWKGISFSEELENRIARPSSTAHTSNIGYPAFDFLGEQNRFSVEDRPLYFDNISPVSLLEVSGFLDNIVEEKQIKEI